MRSRQSQPIDMDSADQAADRSRVSGVSTMDGNRFDQLARTFAAANTRRTFLKRSLATAVALTGLGQAASASAASRPTPTPKPVSCPGRQSWNGSVCACPSGTTACGPDCCGTGGTCCDNACCYGTCYGEELCCPTGQTVCNGVCLAAGMCCTDTDCAGGMSCFQGECTCIPTDTCESLGVECGPATDNCGNPLSCGECDLPFTCDQGQCTCVDNLACDDKCGVIHSQCGATIDCGEDCGACHICGADHTCQPAEDGTNCTHGCTKAVCINGSCSDIHTIDCPPLNAPTGPCSDYACVSDSTGPTCQAVPRNEGLRCTPEAPCQTGVCTNGSCAGTPIECPVCHACTTSTCEPVTGTSCGDGFECVDGGCYAFSGGNDIVSNDIAEAICASLKCEDACCPGETSSTCCGSMDDCFIEGGAGESWKAFCCSLDKKCGDQCCGANESCAGGTVCRRNDQICANDAFCGSGCCGGNGAAGSGICCGSTQQCHNGVCVEVSPDVCDGHDDCLQDSLCAGFITVETPGGVQVVRQGVCCLPEYTVDTANGSICCSPGTYVTGQPNTPCCSWASRNCVNCTCSTTSIRGWRR